MVKCQNKCPKDKYDGCCNFCTENANCDEKCEHSYKDCGMSSEDNTGLEEFQNKQVAVLKELSDILIKKKELDTLEENIREKLQAEMEKHNILKFNSDILDITYYKESTVTSLDSKMIKEKYPDIAAECSKTTNKKAYIKFKLKG